jgi:hypothetical protein
LVDRVPNLLNDELLFNPHLDVATDIGLRSGQHNLARVVVRDAALLHLTDK